MRIVRKIQPLPRNRSLSGTGFVITLAALTVACLTQAPLALAQQEAALEEVVVTGIRRSIEDAIGVKRGASEIVDAISAEDIGRLPDENVAETLQRINGVQIQRRNGEGAGVAVRGLTANRLELSGFTVINPTGRNSGPDEGTYPVLQFIPSSLLSGVEVSKSAAANHIEGSLGGTVNLSILNPLDAGNSLSASLEGGWDERTEDVDPRVAATLTRASADERFGVLLSYSHTERSVGEELYFTRTGWYDAADHSADGVDNPTVGPGDIRLQTLEEDRTRDGFLGSLRFRPTDNAELYLTGFWAQFDLDRDRSWFSSGGSGGNNPMGYTGDVNVSASGSILSGGFVSQIQGNGETLTNESETASIVFGGEVSINDLDLSGSVSYGEAEQADRQDFARVRHNGVAFYRDFSGSIPRLDVTDGFDVSNPAVYDSGSGLIGFSNEIDYENEELAIRGDFEFQLDDLVFFEALRGGVRWTDQEATRHQLRAGNNAGGSVWIVPTPGGLSGNVDPALYRTVPLSDVFGGVSNVDAYIGAHPGGLGSTGALLDFVNANPNEADASRNNQGVFVFQPDGSYGTSEEITSAYLVADFANDNLSGNIGLRYVHTKQDSDFHIITTPGGVRTVTPHTLSRSYDDILPSLNLRLDVTDDVVARFAAAKTMSRPLTGDLNGGVALDEAAGTALGGNPALDPATAIAIDLSVEWYIGDASSLSAAYFYKDVEGFLESITEERVVPGAINSNPASPHYLTNLFLVTTSAATDTSEISGFELSYQNVWEQGFGVQANYTYIDSNGVGNLPLTGLSEHSYNLVGFYERELFSARVAYNWRDNFLVSPDFVGSPMYEDSRGQLDASLQYRINDMFSISLDGLNLTETRVDQYDTLEERPRRIANTGRRLFFGVRMSM